MNELYIKRLFIFLLLTTENNKIFILPGHDEKAVSVGGLDLKINLLPKFDKLCFVCLANDEILFFKKQLNE